MLNINIFKVPTKKLALHKSYSIYYPQNNQYLKIYLLI